MAYRWGPADFFPQIHEKQVPIQLLLEAQHHKKYAQTALLDDGVSSLFLLHGTYA
jgi:hypothetical protein